jgi:hypothetical protein
MSILSHNICIIAEGMDSDWIVSLISDLKTIADRKYQEEKEVEIWNGVISNNK